MPVHTMPITYRKQIVILNSKNIIMLKALVLILLFIFSWYISCSSFHKNVHDIIRIINFILWLNLLRLIMTICRIVFEWSSSWISIWDRFLFLNLKTSLSFMKFQFLFQIFNIWVELKLWNACWIGNFFSMRHRCLCLKVIFVLNFFDAWYHVDHSSNARTVTKINGRSYHIDFWFCLQSSTDYLIHTNF